MTVQSQDIASLFRELEDASKLAKLEEKDNKKKTDKVKKINEDTMEQLDYIENKEGHLAPERLLDEPPPDDFALGGRVSYFDGGIVSLKKKW